MHFCLYSKDLLSEQYLVLINSTATPCFLLEVFSIYEYYLQKIKRKGGTSATHESLHLNVQVSHLRKVP